MALHYRNQQPSAAFRSKSPRDSYITASKLTSHDVPMLDLKSPEPRGGGAASAFKASTPRDLYTRELSKRFVDATYNVPGAFDAASKRSNSCSAAFRGKSTPRDSYIRGTHSVTSEYYNVPGMADALKLKKQGAGIMKGTGHRDSYITELKGRFGDSSANVPGMGDKAVALRRSSTPSAAFRGTTGRDSYLRDTRCRSLGDAPNIPGMADEIARSTKGKFRGGSGKRDSYITSANKPVDAIYDLPGMAQKPGSTIATGSCFKGKGDRCSYITAQRQCSVDMSYNVPGMAEAKKSCSANSAFKSKAKRDSYVSTPRSPDVSYNVPGMADEVARMRTGKWSPYKIERDSHIKASQKFVDAVYHIPGMAELNGSLEPGLSQSSFNSRPSAGLRTPRSVSLSDSHGL